MLAAARIRLAIASLMVGALATSYGCARATYVFREYVPAQLELDSGIRMEVRTSGRWHTELIGDSVVHRSGSPYTLAITVSGTLDSTTIGDVTVVEGTAGVREGISAWEVSSLAPVDSSRVYVVRDRLHLSSPSIRVAGALRVFRRTGVVTIPFSIDLELRTRQESRSRALEVLRGL